MTAAKTIYTDREDYRDATPQALKQAEPSLDFVNDGPSTRPKLVGVVSPGQHEFRAAAQSASGTCFLIRDVVSSGQGVTYARTSGTCRATTKVTYTETW